MKKTNAMSIGEIINKYLKEEHIDGQFNEQQACSLWPQVVGPAINRYTVNRWVKDGVLHIQLSSATLRNELTMNRSIIIKNLNDAVGKPVIKEIIFY
ncbi:MAG: DUF721 domain-containing protein [Bacteroidales bacterium]|nr:DUF721 domain-containing protein [Candidatus Sodaliphilus aphodohippi]